MNLLTRLNNLSAPLALVTLTAFASSALRPSPVWAQSAQAKPELEAVSHEVPAQLRLCEPPAGSSEAPAPRSGACCRRCRRSRRRSLRRRWNVRGETLPTSPRTRPCPEASASAAVQGGQADIGGHQESAADRGQERRHQQVDLGPEGQRHDQRHGRELLARSSRPASPPSACRSRCRPRAAARSPRSRSLQLVGRLGLAGVGWEVGVPFIARQTDRGTPEVRRRSADWHAEQDRFVFNGGQELVPICVVERDAACAGALERRRRRPAGERGDAGLGRGLAVLPAARRRLLSALLLVAESRDLARAGQERRHDGARRSARRLATDANALETQPRQAERDLPLAPGSPVRHPRRRQSASGNPQPVNVVVYRYAQDGGHGVPVGHLRHDAGQRPRRPPNSRDVRAPHAPRLRAAHRSHGVVSQRLADRAAQRLKRVDVTSKTFTAPLATRGAWCGAITSIRRASHVSLLAKRAGRGAVRESGNDAPAKISDGTDRAATNCRDSRR